MVDEIITRSAAEAYPIRRGSSFSVFADRIIQLFEIGQIKSLLGLDDPFLNLISLPQYEKGRVPSLTKSRAGAISVVEERLRRGVLQALVSSA